MYKYMLTCKYWSPEDLKIGATDRRDLIKSSETDDINELIEIINNHGLSIDSSIVDDNFQGSADTMVNFHCDEPHVDLRTGMREYYSLYIMSEAKQIGTLINTIKGGVK